MARTKGLPKTGGRICGTPNKKTALIAEKLAKLGCDPIEGLARIALDSATRVEVKVRCLSELAQYVYPKRKAVDLGSSSEGSDVKVNVEFVGRRYLDLGDLPVPQDVLQDGATKGLGPSKRV